ncbi:MAG: alpha/beta hydrolase [Rubrobacter sp.]|nr:alpha/beta hydrolase [Rubrobacter sp.]
MTQSQDVNLSTVEWGVPEAPHAALLVHGLTGRAEAFEALVEGLDPANGMPDDTWWFVAPDLRGRGASREIGAVQGGIPEHTRDLLGLMDREGLERVVLVGHSMGAMIGVYLAAHYPERLSGLVLIDGGSDVTDEIDALLDPSIKRLEGTYSSREAYLEYLKSQPVFEDRWDEHLQRYFGGDVQPGDDGRYHPVADLQTIRKDREKMYNFVLSELWSRIRCPTLILLSTVDLAGPKEGFILPPDDARRMDNTIPDSSLVKVEDTNHYDILYSAPPTTVKAIENFLATLQT